MLFRWYFRFFYQRAAHRLSTCLITVHAWLHLVDLIEQAGPLWTYWCWVMERYCSRLLRAVSSRKHPYASLNRRILETQGLHAIRNAYNLHDSLPRYTPAHMSRPGSTWETNEEPYQDVRLYGPTRVLQIQQREFSSLRNRLAVFIMTRNGLGGEDRAQVLDALPAKVLQWSKIALKDGDTVTSRLGDNRREENQRCATFCQYELLVDLLAHNPSAEPVLEGRTFFGELDRIILVHLQANDNIDQANDETLVLLDIHSCNSKKDRHGFYEYERWAAREIVSAESLRGVVGRIKNDTKFTFVQRTGTFENALYVDEDGGNND